MKAYSCALALLIAELLTTVTPVHGLPPPAAAPDSLFADIPGPLQLQQHVIDSSEYSTTYEISYQSSDGSTVSAYLVSPKRAGAHAGILFGHWGNGTRAEFLPEAEFYGRLGAVSVLPDYPWDRRGSSRKSLDHFTDPQVDRATLAQAVVELRRGLDVLLQQPGVDPRRIAYIGHSYGAQWGAILTAVDRRVATAIFMGGVPQAADLFLRTTDPDLIGLRNSLPPGQLEKYVDAIGDLDALRFIARASPTPVFLQLAKYEQYYDHDAAIRYIEAARDPKRVKWYGTDHELNDPQCLQDRYGWLSERIGLSADPKR